MKLKKIIIGIPVRLTSFYMQIQVQFIEQNIPKLRWILSDFIPHPIAYSWAS